MVGLLLLSIPCGGPVFSMWDMLGRPQKMILGMGAGQKSHPPPPPICRKDKDNRMPS